MLDRCHAAARCVLACAALAATAAFAGDGTSEVPSYAKLRPGLYGRIEVRGTPPAVIYAEPVVARGAERKQRPVYLYVPPGHVRKWAQHCARWDACERPVYFVRVDDSPSRLGDWKKTQRPQPTDSPVLQVLARITS